MGTDLGTLVFRNGLLFKESMGMGIRPNSSQGDKMRNGNFIEYQNFDVLLLQPISFAVTYTFLFAVILFYFTEGNMDWQGGFPLGHVHTSSTYFIIFLLLISPSGPRSAPAIFSSSKLRHETLRSDDARTNRQDYHVRRT
ncbi:hypothetical protein QBC37DRAFT_166584 [Rhypophila decipiens]|uniref:Uncharacterized protein n=1 Tax=Rhypophila decipiens TaxID=261697 RepID=A0AAN6YGR3_9PEZI|nr:hypothetical protein QBC37DRAFT_166584 [Rhypophila decipiens]